MVEFLRGIWPVGICGFKDRFLVLGSGAGPVRELEGGAWWWGRGLQSRLGGGVGGRGVLGAGWHHHC